MEIRLEQFGRAFSTRPRGAELARSIVDLAGDAGEVTLDFRGVLAVSYSFADELVGALDAAGSAVAPAVTGASADVRAVLERSLERRGLAPGTVLSLPEPVDA